MTEPSSVASRARTGTTFGGPTGGTTRLSADVFFSGLASARSRSTVFLLIAVAVFGAGALPYASATWLWNLSVASLLLLVVLAAVLHWLAGRDRDVERDLYDATLVVALICALPILYLTGLEGPLVGIVLMILLLFNVDAPSGRAIGAVLLVGVPHTLFHVLSAYGVVERHGIVRVEPYLLGDLASAGAVATFYAFVVFFGRAYQRRAGRTFERLAEAGRVVAAREALLREARLDLEQAAGVGQPGRFTEQRLGSFVLGPILGRGGMGEIYEATHAETGERAAVKLLRAPVGADRALLQRFEREAAIARALQSDHVVRLLEVGGLEAALPYLAMERLEGEDLSGILRRKVRVPPKDVADMLTQVADGLDRAMARGVVHRDIKPSNLFRTREGVWKVLDFGVARLSGVSSTITRGQMVGTPGYLAPEQLEPEAELDHRTDQHALATVAYRALTGCHAFSERDIVGVLIEVRGQLPPRPSLLSSCPPDVDDVLRVALAKDPGDRFGSATDMARAFEAALRGEVDASVRARARELERKIRWRNVAEMPGRKWTERAKELGPT